MSSRQMRTPSGWSFPAWEAGRPGLSPGPCGLPAGSPVPSSVSLLSTWPGEAAPRAACWALLSSSGGGEDGEGSLSQPSPHCPRGPQPTALSQR